MTRTDLVMEARSRKGDPWVHQASRKGAGTDCIGLIAGTASACGSEDAIRFLANPAWRNYGEQPDREFLLAGCAEFLDEIAIPEAQEGDIILFYCGKNHPMHFAMLAGESRMIHAWRPAGRVVEHELDAKWRRRITRAFRLRGLA